MFRHEAKRQHKICTDRLFAEEHVYRTNALQTHLEVKAFVDPQIPDLWQDGGHVGFIGQGEHEAVNVVSGSAS